MSKIIEFLSLVFLGILLTLAFTHLLNGTFGVWVGSKFFTKPNPNGTTSLNFPKNKGTLDKESSNTGGGAGPKLL